MVMASLNVFLRGGYALDSLEFVLGLIVTRVIGVLECLEKLCKSLRPSTVFGRTTSFTVLPPRTTRGILQHCGSRKYAEDWLPACSDGATNSKIWLCA
jgi:hypothetical protein